MKAKGKRKLATLKRKLKKPTSFTSAADVIEIIRICSVVGIKHFKWMDISFSFEPIAMNSDKIDSLDPGIKDEVDKVAKKSLKQDEARLTEDRLANLLIEDPMAAEKLLMEQ